MLARYVALPFCVLTLLVAACNDDDDSSGNGDGNNGGDGDSSQCVDENTSEGCLACCQDLPNYAGHAFANGVCMCGTLDESIGSPDGGLSGL